jgi:hypothetical protein
LKGIKSLFSTLPSVEFQAPGSHLAFHPGNSFATFWTNL